MIRKWFLLFAAALVLALGACSTGDDEILDPVATNDTLPNVADLPPLDMSVVSLVDIGNEEAVFDLVSDALEAVMGGIGGAIPLSISSGGRAVQNIFQTFENEELEPGVKVTGFVQGSVVTPDELDDGSYVGQSGAVNLRAKIAADFNVTSSPLTVQGRYYLFADPINVKIEAYKEDTARISGVVSLNGGYAFTVVDTVNKVGAKIVIKLEVQGIKTIDVTDTDDAFDNINPFTKFVYTVEVYDNSGFKARFKYDVAKVLDEINTQIP
jgi:hypothetical protein